MTHDVRDVIVIGAGIAGCLTGYLLAKQGLKVTILEADSVGSHASGFAFGGLGPLDGSGIPDPLLDFSVWCFQRHVTIAQELTEATGIDTQFHLRDRLNLAFKEEEVRSYKEDLKWQREVLGFAVEWLEPQEAIRVEPRTNPDCLGAIFYQGTGAVEAYRYNLAAAQAGETLGAEMLQRRVTGLLSDGDRCLGVTFENGQMEAGLVVLAMGPWSQQASWWSGFNIPIRPLKGQIIRLQLSDDPMRASLNYAGSYAASKTDGLIWAGTTEEEAGFDEELTIAARDKVMGDLLKMAPSLSEAELVQQTACLRPLSEDGIPIVGVVPGWQNLFLATGGGRKGILWSTGMCEGLADLILKGSSTVPGLAALDPNRFPGAD
jgi:glycine oxidase